MNSEIISIGTELLLGEIVDTNSTHISQQLRNIGLNLFFGTTVGDNETRIIEALNIALHRADVVITTGGLGPTVDDVTRQAVAAATGRELVFHQPLLDGIVERFARFGSPMAENNRQQAYLPIGAILIENPVGTAPCFIVESERGVVIVLPGVPREMKYLLEHNVLPYLREKFGLTGLIKTRIIRTAAIGESTIDQAISDLMTLDNPTVGLAAHIGQTDVRITAKAPDETTADQMIAEVEAQVRDRVGDYIYGTGDEKIEEVLVRELLSRNQKISISETGTKNTLCEQIVAMPDGEDVLAGCAQFEDIEALCSTLEIDPKNAPEEIAVQAARHALEQFNTALSIAVIAQSEGMSIAVLMPDTIEKRYYRFDRPGGSVMRWAGTWSMARAWAWLHNMTEKEQHPKE